MSRLKQAISHSGSPGTKAVTHNAQIHGSTFDLRLRYDGSDRLYRPFNAVREQRPCCTGNDLLQSRRMVTEQPDGRRYDFDYAAGAVSLTGAKEAFSFTMHADSANLDVYDTITCDTGACKILIVDTDTKSVAAEYTETAYDTIKLNGGNYTVYLVGKDDASFTTTLSLYSLGGDITWLLDEDTAAKTGK